MHQIKWIPEIKKVSCTQKGLPFIQDGTRASNLRDFIQTVSSNSVEKWMADIF